MLEANQIVDNLSEVQTVKLASHLYQSIYKAVPYKTVTESLVTNIDEVAYIRGLDKETKKHRLDSGQSVEAAKLLLSSFANDDTLAPVLINAWEEVKQDDSLFIEAIIAVGLLANLTLFMASSEIEMEIGGVKIKKGKPSLDVLKAVLEPITELIKRIPNS